MSKQLALNSGNREVADKCSRFRTMWINRSNKRKSPLARAFAFVGVPTGIRTPVATVKGLEMASAGAYRSPLLYGVKPLPYCVS